MRWHIAILAGLIVSASVPETVLAWGRGGFAAGGRGFGGFSGGGARFGGGYNFGTVGRGGYGAGVNYGAYGRGINYGGGYNAGRHSFTGPNGGSIQSGRVGGFADGPYGGFRAGGAGGVRVTTPGGRTVTDAYRGGVNVNPYRGVNANFGHFMGGSGPYGSAAAVHRGGVAVGPYGGVAVGGSRAAVGHSTRYWSSAALINNAAVVRGGYHYGAFTTGWYGRYPGCWRPARWVGPNYWIAPVWANLAAFCAINAQPIYYDYGSNVIIENNNVYVSGEQVGTATDYANQATQYADAGRQVEPAKDDQWQSLGVFGMIQPDDKIAQRIFQIAVNKAGIIRGNYYDAVADTNTPIYGSVDSKSQRACWSIGQKKDIVFETGLNNLTKNQTTILVHYGNDRTDQMMLVRLEEPKGDAK